MQILTTCILKFVIRNLDVLIPLAIYVGGLKCDRPFYFTRYVVNANQNDCHGPILMEYQELLHTLSVLMRYTSGMAIHINVMYDYYLFQFQHHFALHIHFGVRTYSPHTFILPDRICIVCIIIDPTIVTQASEITCTLVCFHVPAAPVNE